MTIIREHTGAIVLALGQKHIEKLFDESMRKKIIRLLRGGLAGNRVIPEFWIIGKGGKGEG